MGVCAFVVELRRKVMKRNRNRRLKEFKDMVQFMVLFIVLMNEVLHILMFVKSKFVYDYLSIGHHWLQVKNEVAKSSQVNLVFLLL